MARRRYRTLIYPARPQSTRRLSLPFGFDVLQHQPLLDQSDRMQPDLMLLGIRAIRRNSKSAG
jgi:hypothetical protein